MKKSPFNFIVLSLFALSFFVLQNASAVCLTDTERNTITQMSNNASVNPDIIINIFERLCNSQYTQDLLNSFNSSLNTKIDSLNSQVSSQLNNSALAQSLMMIGQLYNQSIILNNNTIFVSNQINDFKAEIYNTTNTQLSNTNMKLDNITLTLIERQNKFEDEINQQLIEKQTKNLTTNRIVMIIIGLVLLAGAIYYYSQRRIKAKKNLNPLPYVLDNEQPDATSSKGKKTHRSSGEN